MPRNKTLKPISINAQESLNEILNTAEPIEFCRMEKGKDKHTVLLTITNCDGEYYKAEYYNRFMCNITSEIQRQKKFDIEFTSFLPDEMEAYQTETFSFLSDGFSKKDFILMCCSGEFSPKFITETMKNLETLFSKFNRSRLRVLFCNRHLAGEVQNLFEYDKAYIIEQQFSNEIDRPMLMEKNVN